MLGFGKPEAATLDPGLQELAVTQLALITCTHVHFHRPPSVLISGMSLPSLSTADHW
jgi:hypothetical protein